MEKINSERELRDNGINFELVTLIQTVHTVYDVQMACKCEAAEVIKTLVFTGSNPVVAIIPGNKRANIAKIEEITGERGLRMAKPAEVMALTNYGVGSVSPFGINPAIKQIADNSVLALSSLFLGSGKSDVLIKISQIEFGKSFRGTFASISD
ncbi:MAG: YbaK/EbsC family protein [bacterium]|nr:YbaK/EbsC family protein [bacterium]